jgi:hypothetical protein
MFLGEVISMSLLLVLLKHLGVLDIVIDMLQILSVRLQRASGKQAKGKMFNVHIVNFILYSLQVGLVLVCKVTTNFRHSMA